MFLHLVRIVIQLFLDRFETVEFIETDDFQQVVKDAIDPQIVIDA